MRGIIYIRLAMVVAVAAVIGWAGIKSHIWPQTNYASSGVCSVQEIDRTYMALMKTGRMAAAISNRMSSEYWSHTKAVYPIQIIPAQTLEMRIKAVVYKDFWKRQTAAFACSHGNAFFDTTPRVNTVPKIEALLRPLISDQAERWEIAACAAMRETYAPMPLTEGTIDLLRQTCAAHVTTR